MHMFILYLGTYGGAQITTAIFILPGGAPTLQTHPISRPGVLPKRHGYIQGSFNMLTDPWIYPRTYEDDNNSLDVSVNLSTCKEILGYIQ